MTKTSSMPSALRLAALAALALTLGGCAVQVVQTEPQERALALSPSCERCKPNPAKPRVLVSKGFVSVDLEPLRFFKSDGEVTITWQLPANEPYTFDRRGIEIVGATPLDPRAGMDPKLKDRAAAADVKKELRCEPAKDPRQYLCHNLNQVRGMSYKYVVRVLDGEKKPLEPLDPIIVNEF